MIFRVAPRLLLFPDITGQKSLVSDHNVTSIAQGCGVIAAFVAASITSVWRAPACTSPRWVPGRRTHSAAMNQRRAIFLLCLRTVLRSRGALYVFVYLNSTTKILRMHLLTRQSLRFIFVVVQSVLQSAPFLGP